jgi:hypothetical protein
VKEEQMMKRVIVLALMVLLLVVFPLVGCSNSSGGTTNPIGLVPAKANMIAQADVSSILQDKDLTGIYDKIPKGTSYPHTFNDALTQLKDKYNIDLKGFQEGVLFTDISQSGGGGNYSGAIVKGTFNKDDLITALESGSDIWNTNKYKDYDIYSNELSDTAFAFLTDNIFVIGAIQPVKDVIDVENGDAKALSGEVMDTYNGLGDALIKVAVAVPPGAIEGSLGQSASQILGNLSAFDKVKTVGITVSKNDASVTLNVKLCCADSDSAQGVEGSINNLISFVRLVMSLSGNQAQKQMVNNLLNKVEVGKSDSCVNITLTATITEIENLLQSSNQSSGQSG